MTSRLLETINSPADLRRLPRADLQKLADELRAYVLNSVAKTGGHLDDQSDHRWQRRDIIDEADCRQS